VEGFGWRGAASLPPPCYRSLGVDCKLSIHLGEARHDMEEEPSSRSTRVDGVREADEVDALLLEAAHEIDELLHAPTQPVELPDHERVASPQDVEGSLEPRTVGNPATHSVLEELLAPGVRQCVLLHVETWGLGRDTAQPIRIEVSPRGRISELVENRAY
jgi:hypothetical protein